MFYCCWQSHKNLGPLDWTAHCLYVLSLPFIKTWIPLTYSNQLFVTSYTQLSTLYCVSVRVFVWIGILDIFTDPQTPIFPFKSWPIMLKRTWGKRKQQSLTLSQGTFLRWVSFYHATILISCTYTTFQIYSSYPIWAF